MSVQVESLDVLPSLVCRFVSGTFGLYILTWEEGAPDAESWEATSIALILAGARTFWFAGPHADQLELATDWACAKLEARQTSRDRALPTDLSSESAVVITASCSERELALFYTTEQVSLRCRNCPLPCSLR